MSIHATRRPRALRTLSAARRGRRGTDPSSARRLVSAARAVSLAPAPRRPRARAARAPHGRLRRAPRVRSADRSRRRCAQPLRRTSRRPRSARSPGHPLHIDDVVAVRDQEVISDHCEPLRTRRASALTGEVQSSFPHSQRKSDSDRVAGERLVDLLDALVHPAEERFVLRDPLLPRIHLGPILGDFDADETILDDDVEDVHRKIGG